MMDCTAIAFQKLLTAADDTDLYLYILACSKRPGTGPERAINAQISQLIGMTQWFPPKKSTNDMEALNRQRARNGLLGP